MSGDAPRWPNVLREATAERAWFAERAAELIGRLEEALDPNAPGWPCDAEPPELGAIDVLTEEGWRWWRVEGPGLRLALGLDDGAAHDLVSVALGGAPEADEELPVRSLGRMSQAILDAVVEAWIHRCWPEAEIVVMSKPQEFVPRPEAAILVHQSWRLGCERRRCTVATPLSLVRRRLLADRAVPRGEAGDASLPELPVELLVRLRPFRLPAAELVGLTAGDELPLPVPADRLEVVVDGAILYEAEAIADDGRLGIRLFRRLGAAEHLTATQRQEEKDVPINPSLPGAAVDAGAYPGGGERGGRPVAHAAR